MQVGFSGYHDLRPLATPNADQRILSGYAVYHTSSFELMNEVVLIRQSLDIGLPITNATGFYSQISRCWSSYCPYFRYEYVNVPDRDLIYPDMHRTNGPVVGLRYDWGEFTALEIQYGRTMRRALPSFNTLPLQSAFTF